jgi:flavin reductase (DIM6/NTAB) family NADH-FMN oxidoreductase RutF
MKQQINVFDYSEQIMKALRRGILLNTNGDKFNSMVISWGHFGIIWGEATFAVYVRENRYTKPQLDKTREFTLSIPLDKPDPLINKVCGSLSGHNIDKVAEAKLTLVEPETNRTPAVAEYPLTLECKVLYSQKQDLSLLPEDIRESCYPQDVDGTNPLANRDPHTLYIGKIVNAYIIRQ